MSQFFSEVDALWRTVKPWGWYQLFQLFLIIIDFFPACFAILSAVFTGYTDSDFTCAEVSGSNVTNSSEYTYSYGSCSYDIYERSGNGTSLVETKTCDRYSYNQVNTYTTEWNLVCSRSSMAALAQSLVLAGQGIGALTMSHLADRFGRKTIHVISHIGVCLTMFVMAFSQNILMLSILRLVTGTFQQGIICTGKILALEMFPREIRSHMEPLTFLAWAGGIMTLTLFGYVFRFADWRYLQIALACFSIYAFLEWWLMEESVRWLLSNGKEKEAERILRKAARWNNVDYSKIEALNADSSPVKVADVKVDNTSDNLDGSYISKPLVVNSDASDEKRSVSTSENSDSTVGSATVKRYTVIDILKNPALRINTLILWYTWIVATGTYYGLTLVSSHLAGDRFVNFFLSGLIEIPGLLAEIYLFNKIGRKRTMILWYTIAGVSMITSTALLTAFTQVKAVSTLATIFSLIGKMAITGSFSTVFLYTPEIYPTNYRNSGLGIASSISRIGGILAPFASNLALIALWIPGAIFGSMCLLVSVLALRLPESASHELPKTIAECDAWDKHSSSESSSDREMATLSEKM